MEYIFLSGEIGWEITVQNVAEKFEKLNNKDVKIYLTTYGGDAFEGVAIYNLLKEKQNQGYNITTVASGITASAGTFPFLAGNKNQREAINTSTFLIHNASALAGGDSERLGKTAKELQRLNEKMALIYEAETNLTKEEALIIMQEEKAKDARWLLENGFITNIVEHKAVAKLNRNFKNTNMNENLTLNKADKTWIEGLFSSMKSVFKPKNKILQDANAIDIDFYDLEADQVPKVGDKAKIDEKPANGENVMPSGETYVFVNGELIEIQPKEEEEKSEKLEAEITELKKQLAKTKTEKTEVEAKVAKIQSQFEDLEKNIKSKFNLDFNQEQKNVDENSTNEIRNRKIF